MNSSLNLMYKSAINAFENGNLESAGLILQNLLRIAPYTFDGLHLLAIVFASRGDHKGALEYYVKALKLSPNNASALSNYGSSLNALGKNLEALVVFNRALSINPEDSDIWYNTGNTLCDLGRHEEALSYYQESIRRNPGYYQAHNNYGKALFDLNRYEESLFHFDTALEINQDFLECLINKGEALRRQKRYQEALLCERKVIVIKPDYAEVWSNIGNILKDLKRYDEAVVHYEKALSLKPDYAEAWLNIGVIFRDLKRYDEAMAHYEKALSLKPDYAKAWLNIGVIFRDLKRYDEAVVHYEKALSLSPWIDWVYGDLLHIKMQMCSWSGFERSLEIVLNQVLKNQRILTPFVALALTDHPFIQKKSAEIYAQQEFPLNSELGVIPGRHKGEKIRVGYFSADFKDHAVSILTAELFELHDKNRFEIVAFSFGADDNSLMRLRLSQAFSQFIDVSDMSDIDIAKLSREMQVDIAVDLGGYTANSRSGIFAHQSAPIQISYIGYLGTMGAPYINYLIADKTIIPEGSQKFYSEMIAYLPSYQANDRKRAISDKQLTRRELGLPEKGFVFCCFNNNYKILPATFNGWMRILKAVEGSVLFLYAENNWAEHNLTKEAHAIGIDGSRIIFGQRLSKDEYLARYRTCDLFLDTFPYNAGTTASDALWAGLPVLTLMGESFPSRVAASLLNAIDLPELITNSQEGYENLAIELAKNSLKLAEIKSKLANRRLTAPLFDTPLFTKNLEAAYIKMYETYYAGLPADNIYI